MTTRPPVGETGGIRRRTVLRTSAWAVPALVVAAPAPAYAASPGRGTIAVLGLKAGNTSRSALTWDAFSIRYDANGGPLTTSARYEISTNPTTQVWQSSNFTLQSGVPEPVAAGATLPLPPGTYRVVVTVTSDVGVTAVVESDPVSL